MRAAPQVLCAGACRRAFTHCAFWGWAWEAWQWAACCTNARRQRCTGQYGLLPRGSGRTPPSSSPAKPALSKQPEPVAAKRKLGFKEARELEQLPARIETLEAEVARRTEAMNDPAYYQQSPADLQRANEELAAKQAELDHAYQRWSELDG